jgi:hypothetical protein
VSRCTILPPPPLPAPRAPLCTRALSFSSEAAGEGSERAEVKARFYSMAEGSNDLDLTVEW